MKQGDALVAVSQVNADFEKVIADLLKLGADPRGMAIARTHLETATMYVRKSVFVASFGKQG